MRKANRAQVLAVLTLLALAITALPSTAAVQPPRSPKGKVYFSTDLGPAWVVVIGEGPNPVPVTLIEYDQTFCLDRAGKPQPGIRTGLASVGAVAPDGTRRIDGSARFVCANEDMTTIPVVGFGFVYNTKTGKLLAPDPAFPVTLSRICVGTDVPGANTILGTGGADTLEGTPRMDIIDGRGGRDTINARGGNDIVCAGGGNDIVHGNQGVDLILGQGGRDRLFGDAGKDVLFGGSNPDRLEREILKGGPGWDVIFGWDGRDKLLGNGGADVLFGGPRGDLMNGGAGDDECYDPAGKAFAGCEVTGP